MSGMLAQLESTLTFLCAAQGSPNPKSLRPLL